MQPDPEAPAKNYQVLEVSNAVTRIEAKLDKILENQVTPAELKLLERNFEDKLRTQRVEIGLTYDPMANSIKWFSRAIVVGVIAGLGDLIANLVLIIGRH